MAVTGCILIFFLLMHMFGNLKLLGGADEFNNYAGFLRRIANPLLPGETFLWLFRIFMLAAIVLHIWSAFRVDKQNRAGRGGAGRYSIKKSLSPENTYAARTMIWGGIIIVLFLILHLLQFTIMPAAFGNPHDGALGRAGMVITAFGHWWYVLIYLIAIIAVCMHVSHGFWAAFATLGVNNSVVARKVLRVLSWLVAVVLLIGFMLPPFLVLFGVIS
ncbi:succinate dehydrogenase cytochrome b subunit [Acidipropionibacterium timonense]|uniref:succinate dehydrogenase cytochrome b subunit n=1 Tax=Acidipropionibacterium timonense TaxID=2161818 RepID=UPI001FD90DC0